MEMRAAWAKLVASFANVEALTGDDPNAPEAVTLQDSVWPTRRRKPSSSVSPPSLFSDLATGPADREVAASVPVVPLAAPGAKRHQAGGAGVSGASSSGGMNLVEPDPGRAVPVRPVRQRRRPSTCGRSARRITIKERPHGRRWWHRRQTSRLLLLPLFRKWARRLSHRVSLRLRSPDPFRPTRRSLRLCMRRQRLRRRRPRPPANAAGVATAVLTARLTRRS